MGSGSGRCFSCPAGSQFAGGAGLSIVGFVVKISPRLENLFDIIHEDADLLAINKTAGLVCHPTKGDEFSSLISRARLYLKPSTLNLQLI